MIEIKILKTGEVRRIDESYANRLIEQGKAIPAPRQGTEKKPAKKAEA